MHKLYDLSETEEGMACERHVSPGIRATMTYVELSTVAEMREGCMYCQQGSKATKAVHDHERTSTAETRAIRDLALARALEIMRLNRVTEPSVNELLVDARKIEDWLTRP